MKVSRVSHEQLELRQSLGVIGAIIIAVAAATTTFAMLVSPFGSPMVRAIPLLVVAVIAIVVFSRSVRVTFDRPSRRVTIVTKRLTGSQTRDIPLEQVLGARLQVSRRSGHATTYLASLLVRKDLGVEDVPMSVMFSNSAGHAAAVDAVNRWLSGREA